MPGHEWVVEPRGFPSLPIHSVTPADDIWRPFRGWQPETGSLGRLTLEGVNNDPLSFVLSAPKPVRDFGGFETWTGPISLTGTLRCATSQDAAPVARILTGHLRLMQAEAGRLWAKVTALPGGLGRAGQKRFGDRAACLGYAVPAARSVRGQAAAQIATDVAIFNKDDLPQAAPPIPAIA